MSRSLKVNATVVTPSKSLKSSLKSGYVSGRSGCGQCKARNDCCNALLTSYGSTILKGSTLLTGLIREAAVFIELPGYELKLRIQLIRLLYVQFKSLFELFQCKAIECKTKCCEGLAAGSEGLSLGILEISVANALNPLFDIAEVAEGLGLAFNELCTGFNHLLKIAGCDDPIDPCPPFLVPPPLLAAIEAAHVAHNH